jgi:2-keto-4-pentenoate hydratase/2-oxohepta-3-ene-1,7-dioic acid hydratase in catechol pathway
MAKIVRYQLAGRVGYGYIEGDLIQPMEGSLEDLRPSSAACVKAADVKLLSPTAPSKIIAIGPNFRTYFADGSMTAPSQPMLWTKPATCRNDPEGVIELPPGHTVNHECELAIVIGRTAKNVAIGDAASHILGYTCMNDVTAGDFATPGAFGASHYFVDGKIFDGFAPLGPCIVTGLDVSDLKMMCRVNGELRQNHSTSDFLFTPEFLVAMISQVMTLLPGDVISMGSPPGVSPIVDGDVVEIEIENIGVLRSFVRARPETQRSGGSA